MEKYFFMKPVLEYLGKGKVFKRIYALILRIAAILGAITGLFIWIRGWVAIFQSGSVGIIVGGIIVELLMLVFFYVLIHLLWLRADTIEKIPETEYTVTPIMSVSLKLLGEIYAACMAFLGVAGGLFMWVAGSSLEELLGGGYASPSLPFFYGGGGFIGGLMMMVLGCLVAFGVLVLFYFLAEIIIVLVDIARNTAKK